jgi:hypothetical protein
VVRGRVRAWPGLGVRVGFGLRVRDGVEARARVEHERAWVHDAAEVLVTGEEGVDKHDRNLPIR